MSDGPTPNQIAEARAMGWQPLEKFKGDPEKWVDADEFVQRGEHFMPLLKSNNQRLKQDLLQRDQKIGTLEQQLESVNAAVKALQANANKQTERAVEQALTKLKADLRQAREEGDVDAEVQILGAIQDTQETRRQLKEEAEKRPEPKKPEPKTGILSPELQEWEASHPEIFKDRKKLRAFTRLCEDLREDGEADGLVGEEFLEFALSKMEEQEEETPRATNKVEAGRSGVTKSGKGWASLPAAAKAICEEQADLFVGDGKLYKDKKAWQEAFAKDYYAD